MVQSLIQIKIYENMRWNSQFDPPHSFPLSLSFSTSIFFSIYFFGFARLIWACIYVWMMIAVASVDHQWFNSVDWLNLHMIVMKCVAIERIYGFNSFFSLFYRLDSCRVRRKTCHFGLFVFFFFWPMHLIKMFYFFPLCQIVFKISSWLHVLMCCDVLFFSYANY